MKSVFVFIGVYILTIAATNASVLHESVGSVNRLERLWRDHNFVYKTYVKAKEKGLTKQESKAFFTVHLAAIDADKAVLIEEFHHVDSTRFGEIENWLVQKEEEYSQKLDNFIADKAANNDAYKTAMAALSIPPPTPPPGPVCDEVDVENPTLGSGGTVATFSNWAPYKGQAGYYDADDHFGVHLFALQSNFKVAGATTDKLVLENGGYDPWVSNNRLTKVCPGGTYSLRLENHQNDFGAASAIFTFTVDATKPYYKYKYAVVLEDPGEDHDFTAKPYFAIDVYDETADEYVECASYIVHATKADGEFESRFKWIEPGHQTMKFKPWTSELIPLHDRIGHVMKVQFVVADCPYGGHRGYAYLDGDCLDNNLSIGSCNINGTRIITGPEHMASYNWSGPGIVGNNAAKDIVVNKAGGYVLYGITNAGCPVELAIEASPCEQPEETHCMISSFVTTSVGSCDESDSRFSVSGSLVFTNPPSTGVLIISDGLITKKYYPPFASPISFTLEQILADGQMHTLKAAFYPTNYTTDEEADCHQFVNYEAPDPCGTVDIPCPNCIGSFKPEPGKKYVVSAWVHDEDFSSNPDMLTFTDPRINVFFTGSGTTYTCYAAGKIIDGWQRIYYEFEVPSSATEITVQLASNSGYSDFDDIRIYPINGSIKTYVYDPVSLKLVAVLDENNYATMYEYDQEGSLVRTKKETERGVVTISENRQSNPKR